MDVIQKRSCKNTCTVLTMCSIARKHGLCACGINKCTTFQPQPPSKVQENLIKMFQLGKIDATTAMKMLSESAVNQAPSTTPSNPAVDGGNAASEGTKKRPRNNETDNGSDSEIEESALENLES